MLSFRRSADPNIYLFITFLLLIIFGASLLKLPVVKFNGHLSVLDALFTSTSAVCVTGLTVVDVSDFNTIGQIFIILLMELGGLGIMYLSATLFLLLRGQLSFKQRLMFKEFHGSYDFYNMEYILPIIILYTFLIEFIGMCFLTAGFCIDGYSFGTSVYYAIFHSVSAFCNAGLSIFDENLIHANSLIKVTIMGLIVLGGIGFYVVYDVYERIKKPGKFRLHTKVVVITTVFLILIGAFLLFLLEWGKISIIDAFFQSITPRTAGFNTVDLTKLSQASKFLLIFLMIIGASPASTGGGVKTSTAFLTLLAIYLVLKGKFDFIIFKRKVPVETILRAFSIVLLYLFVLFFATTLILVTHRLNLLEVVFEVASAMGTVGLSLGVTRELTEVGKIIIILCMFLGRIGPASLLIIMIKREKTQVVSYPEEKILLG